VRTKSLVQKKKKKAQAFSGRRDEGSTQEKRKTLLLGEGQP